ncbi:uncharacterized protein B0H64DRAFT_401659 [Chaetomium fimeti]|uniref:Uncharacterized protein n=1 Tax=Chaetomium fimeti TaxID=1854472 RepID=A0AAE0HE08_9PEZI|nr:hypothetical protein B0H64DRAFT_401659 [Chaetomium fimeti]
MDAQVMPIEDTFSRPLRSKGTRAWTLSRQSTGTAAPGPSSCRTSRYGVTAGVRRAVDVGF